MASGFTCEACGGFGLPLSDEELARVNQFRSVRGRDQLTTSPGLRTFEYGAKKEGYWGYKHFAEQVTDVLVVYFQVGNPHPHLLL